MKKALLIISVCLLTLMPLFSAVADENTADEADIYLLMNDQNTVVTSYAGVPEMGDEYIASDNQYYRVQQVDTTRKVAMLETVGLYEMPDVSWLDAQGDTLPASSVSKAIAIYCTHSDESYVPTDGTSSDEQRGGIYDVADALKTALEKKGVTVYLSDNTHHPHDAGAYRRSRATAAELLKNGVDAILDIHRDGIPNPKEYKTNVSGDSMTKIRLEVGRSNQNSSANKEFATRLKAIADKVYPGLVKDIYIGKGTYNQDLASHAILLEFGTHTTSKEDAEKATAYMADVLYRSLYGGVTGAAGASDVNYTTSTGTTSGKDDNKGAWTGILWVLGVLIVGAIIYALAATGRFKPAMEKAGGTFKEMFGGLFGKKKGD